MRSVDSFGIDVAIIARAGNFKLPYTWRGVGLARIYTVKLQSLFTLYQNQ